jgi:hypothetical protein
MPKCFLRAYGKVSLAHPQKHKATWYSKQQTEVLDYDSTQGAVNAVDGIISDRLTNIRGDSNEHWVEGSQWIRRAGIVG